jgi:hypothetical protein
VALLGAPRKAANGKAADFFVRVASQAKQGYSGTEYTQPAETENDPKQHRLYRFISVLLGWVVGQGGSRGRGSGSVI